MRKQIEGSVTGARVNGAMHQCRIDQMTTADVMVALLPT